MVAFRVRPYGNFFLKISTICVRSLRTSPEAILRKSVRGYYCRLSKGLDNC